MENDARRQVLTWAALEGTDLGLSVCSFSRVLNLALSSLPSWMLEETTDGFVL